MRVNALETPPAKIAEILRTEFKVGRTPAVTDAAPSTSPKKRASARAYFGDAALCRA
jgi:hypothetical protein